MFTAWLLGWLLLSQIYPSAGILPVDFSHSDLPDIEAAPAASTGAPRRITDPLSLGVQLTARNFLALDVDSRAVLFSQDAYRAVPIASLTKLMTGLLLAESQHAPDQLITMKAEDEVGGSRLALATDEAVAFQDLFIASLIASGNNGIAALVRSSSSTRDAWVTAMNAKARQLGMSQTQFFDPTGLDPRNVSTAHDISLLAIVAFRQPQLKNALLQSHYNFRTATGRSMTVFSTDQLLGSFLNKAGEYRMEGGKTGYLPEAGYCLATEIVKDGHHIITVVLGSRTLADRFQDTKSLAYWVFNNYQW